MTRIMIRFNDSEYRFSHGKAPRGRGSWAFSVSRDPNPSSTRSTGIFWTPGNTTYVQAKKLARAHYIAEIGDGHLCGPFIVYVLP